MLAPPRDFLVELRPTPCRFDPDSQVQMLRVVEWSQSIILSTLSSPFPEIHLCSGPGNVSLPV